MLTRKQHELLLYVDGFLKEHGVSPSFEEMKEALDLKSKSGIHRLIKALEERNFIRRLPNRARALEVLRLPGSAPSVRAAPEPERAAPGVSGPEISGNVVRGAFGRNRPRANDEAGVAIPLHGRIAAGTPIEALEHVDSTIMVPPSMLRGGEHYGLMVDGDSMVDLGILDGDTVIIERRDTAQNGEIVVALVDGAEATLKTFRQSNGMIELKPANSAYKTQIYPGSRVRIQGRLVGLLRRY